MILPGGSSARTVHTTTIEGARQASTAADRAPRRAGFGLMVCALHWLMVFVAAARSPGRRSLLGPGPRSDPGPRPGSRGSRRRKRASRDRRSDAGLCRFDRDAQAPNTRVARDGTSNRYEPNAQASGFGRASATHSLACRAHRRTATAGRSPRPHDTSPTRKRVDSAGHQPSTRWRIGLIGDNATAGRSRRPPPVHRPRRRSRPRAPASGPHVRPNPRGSPGRTRRARRCIGSWPGRAHGSSG